MDPFVLNWGCRYDAGMGAWVPLADMGAARRNLALAALAGELVALGGHDGAAPVVQVEQLAGRTGGQVRQPPRAPPPPPLVMQTPCALFVRGARRLLPRRAQASHARRVPVGPQGAWVPHPRLSLPTDASYFACAAS